MSLLSPPAPASRPIEHQFDFRRQLVHRSDHGSRRGQNACSAEALMFRLLVGALLAAQVLMGVALLTHQPVLVAVPYEGHPAAGQWSWPAPSSLGQAARRASPSACQER